jgi:hypothetical protein
MRVIGFRVADVKREGKSTANLPTTWRNNVTMWRRLQSKF